MRRDNWVKKQLSVSVWCIWGHGSRQYWRIFEHLAEFWSPINLPVWHIGGRQGKLEEIIPAETGHWNFTTVY